MTRPTIQTREERLDEINKKNAPACPHCNSKMALWEVPPIAVGDGLGWGEPFLFVCFNDECTPFKEGWKNIEDNYAHKASYRCMNYPGTTQFEFMPVYSRDGGKGQIYDKQAQEAENAKKEATKIGFSLLAEFYVTNTWDEILKILIDHTYPVSVRMKAAEMIGDIGGIEATEILINNKFPNDFLQKQVDESITKLHLRFFTKECPFCAEIIKQRAKVCKHCQKNF